MKMTNNLKSKKMPIIEFVCVLYIVGAIAYFCGHAIGTFHGHLDNSKTAKLSKNK